MPTNMTTQQGARDDANGVTVLGWENANDVIVTKQTQMVSSTVTLTTSPQGNITLPIIPISPVNRSLDYAGNLTYNWGISVIDAGNSTPYFYGNVDPVNGFFTVYTTSALSTTVNSTSVKITYFYLAPVEGIVNADGTVTPNTNVQTNVILPTDSQSRLQNTIQTHNAVSVATVTYSYSSFIDANGFDRVGLTFLNDSAIGSSAGIQWSNDGSTQHGYESLWSNQTSQFNQAETAIKSRYFRVFVYNNDTVSHTMSSWVYLKV